MPLYLDHAQGNEDYSITVAFLRHEVRKTIEIEGENFELWLRKPNTKKLKPYTEILSGTGFFIGIGDASPHPYLVTASHVAKQMSPSAQAVIEGPNDTPITIYLSDLTQEDDRLNWIEHDHADVAVLPISPKNVNIMNKLEKHFLRIDVLEQQELSPNRDTPLTILGFYELRPFL